MNMRNIMAGIDRSALVLDVDTVSRGHVRITTGFLYPEGSSMDLFLVNTEFTDGALKLTDFGSTLEWLMDLEVYPENSPAQTALLIAAARNCGVSFERGALELDLATVDELPDAIMRLGQTCLRVADLFYTTRGDFGAVSTSDTTGRPPR
jgi:hypothetical protein